MIYFQSYLNGQFGPLAVKAAALEVGHELDNVFSRIVQSVPRVEMKRILAMQICSKVSYATSR